MKRMSEVFELPVSSGDRGYYADDVFQAGGSGEWCSTFCTDEQAQHATHAINHADALADALASLLEAYFQNGRVTTDDAACALKVLKSYAGDDK